MLAYLIDQLGKAGSKSGGTADDLAKTAAQLTSSQADIKALQDAMPVLTNVNVAAMSSAMSGDMVLTAVVPSENVAATDLNAAAAGSFKRSSVFMLKTAAGAQHIWCSVTPVLVAGEAVTDADVAAPVVTGTPKFSGGVVSIEITFDTDAGATKTYVAGDAVTVQVKVSAGDTLLGFTVASVTKTFAVV